MLSLLWEVQALADPNCSACFDSLQQVSTAFLSLLKPCTHNLLECKIDVHDLKVTIKISDSSSSLDNGERQHTDHVRDIQTYQDFETRNAHGSARWRYTEALWFCWTSFCHVVLILVCITFNNVRHSMLKPWLMSHLR